MRLLTLAAVAALAFAYYSRNSRVLDGTLWDVSMKADAFFSLPHRHTLMFDKGNLISSEHTAQGFSPATYQETPQTNGAEAWSATLSSPKQGTMNWEGLAQADKIQGTVVWYQGDRRVQKYSFIGKKKTE